MNRLTITLFIAGVIVGANCVYNEAPCSTRGGRCLRTTSTPCVGGHFQSRLCPTQPNDVRCCLPDSPVTTSSRTLDQCVACICKVESGCRPLTCRWDVNSLSCGYYQIKLPYYIDCGRLDKRPGESDTVAWKRCALDKHCATRCVKAYYRRYKRGRHCAGKSVCEAAARLHNGGPSGCGWTATDRYWRKVQTCR